MERDTLGLNQYWHQSPRHVGTSTWAWLKLRIRRSNFEPETTWLTVEQADWSNRSTARLKVNSNNYPPKPWLRQPMCLRLLYSCLQSYKTVKHVQLTLNINYTSQVAQSSDDFTRKKICRIAQGLQCRFQSHVEQYVQIAVENLSGHFFEYRQRSSQTSWTYQSG